MNIKSIFGVLAIVGAGLLGSAPSQTLATPLASGSWTQVGNMSGSTTSNDGMFNGNCNLSATCTYNTDSAGDFWTPFSVTAGMEMLFISGDRQIWAKALYSDILAVMASASSFDANITWSDAGLNGASLGNTTQGNILFRSSAREDPWITLRGGHCAHRISGQTFPTSVNDCNLIIWGENDFNSAVHKSLKNSSGGIEVYVSSVSAVPLPASVLFLMAGVGGFAALRRKQRTT